MKFDPKIHHRRSIRLRGYDYAQAGAYFVTICAQDRQCMFGSIVDGEPRLNEAGRMIETVWDEMPIHYPGIEIDAFITMPNHIHGIVVIVANDDCTDNNPVGATPRGCPDIGQSRQSGQAQGLAGQARGPAPTIGKNDNVGLSLPDVVHRFKTMTTKRYIDGVKHHGWSSFPGKLWQRNYWEHLIRSESELNRIREYIQNNPAQWEMDKLFVGAGPRACPTTPRSWSGV